MDLSHVVVKEYTTTPRSREDDTKFVLDSVIEFLGELKFHPTSQRELRDEASQLLLDVEALRVRFEEAAVPPQFEHVLKG
jgi:hypothetical protein